MRNIGSSQVRWKYHYGVDVIFEGTKKTIWYEDTFKQCLEAFYLGNKLITVCEIVKDDQVIGTGKSVCHPGDNFNKLEGRTRALGRALLSTKLDKSARATFWEAYRTSRKKPLWEIRVQK